MTSVQDNGGKPALVLLHGWGAHGGVWDELRMHLNPELHVIAPDLPGHGMAPLTAPYSIEHVVDQLAAAVPEHCIVAGWSLGGQLALVWAQRHPQQVTKLVLIATTPRFVSDAGWLHGMAGDVFAEFSAALARDAAATLRRFVLLQIQGDRQARAVARQMDAVLATRPVPETDALIQTLHWLRETDLRAALPAIVQPSLIVQGDQDRITFPAAGAYLAAHLPHARLMTLIDAAHVPFMPDAATVAGLVTDFCHEH